LEVDEPVNGLWVTLEASAIIDIEAGLDWIVIDAERGHFDWAEILEHLRATVRSNTVTLIRLTKSRRQWRTNSALMALPPVSPTVSV
jgi:2-keto-3-deoxy-L-rhamnonate aldolase RhmA